MAKLTGKDLKLLLKSSEVSGDFREVTCSSSADEIDTTTFGDSSRQFISGYIDGNMSVTGFWESGAGNSDAILNELEDDTTAYPITVVPAGLTAGNRALLLNAVASGISRGGGENDAVAASGTFVGAGGAKWGQLLYAADVSATGNGTGYDNPSDDATTQGAAFHLHVTANDRDAGTLDVKIQDSADNSTFADVSGLAFTQVAAAATTNERITLASGTSLKRYVRAVVTVAGGTTGDYTVRVAYTRAF